MLYIIDVNKRKEPFGIVGTQTVITDDNNNVLYVGDIVKVTHKSTKWSKLRMVCYKDSAFIQGVPHMRQEDIKDIALEKVIDHSKLTDGFQLYDNLIVSKI